LEEEIIPLYYKDSNHDVSHGWVTVMKESIKSCGAMFSARRMVMDYIDKYYRRALQNSLKR
jgi:starch phosphorylase